MISKSKVTKTLHTSFLPSLFIIFFIAVNTHNIKSTSLSTLKATIPRHLRFSHYTTMTPRKPEPTVRHSLLPAPMDLGSMDPPIPGISGDGLAWPAALVPGSLPLRPTCSRPRHASALRPRSGQAQRPRLADGLVFVHLPAAPRPATPPQGHAPPGHAHSHRRPRAPWNPPRMSMRTEGGRRPEAPGGPLTRKRPAGAARASPSGDAGPGRHGLSHGAALAAKPPHRPLLAGPGGAEARAGESAARAPRPLRPAAPGVRGPRRQPSFPLS